MSRLLFPLPNKMRCHVHAIYRPFDWNFCIGQSETGIKQIQAARHFVSHARFDFSRPTRNCRNAITAFPSAALPSRNNPDEPPFHFRISQGPLSLVKNDQCILLQIFLAQCLQNLADAPVNFFNGVTVNTTRTFPFEFIRSKQRHVRKRVGKIEEKWLLSIGFNEANRLPPYNVSSTWFGLLVVQ